MKFVSNENLVSLLFGVVGFFFYGLVQDVQRHNVAFAQNEVRFAGYDGMTQIVQDIRLRVDAIERKQDLILEELKKRKEPKK